MTAQELIKKLQVCDPQSEVFMNYETYVKTEVESVFKLRNGEIVLSETEDYRYGERL